jgi:hypothetical protein
MIVREILEEAIKLIQERGWFQKRLGKPGQVCLGLAIARTSGSGPEKLEALLLLRTIISQIPDNRPPGSFYSIVDWNDAPGRTKEDVVGLLRKGIETCTPTI